MLHCSQLLHLLCCPVIAIVPLPRCAALRDLPVRNATRIISPNAEEERQQHVVVRGHHPSAPRDRARASSALWRGAGAAKVQIVMSGGGFQQSEQQEQQQERIKLVYTRRPTWLHLGGGRMRAHVQQRGHDGPCGPSRRHLGMAA